MPIYEYQCEKCQKIFEVTQKISDPPIKKHDCGSKKVRRLISRTSFQLKGDGWYVTDYAAKKSTAESSTPSTSAETPSTDTSAEKASTTKAEKSVSTKEKSEEKKSTKSQTSSKNKAA